jgi:HAD superfamily hydrolase (TIGR01509 family)
VTRRLAEATAGPDLVIFDCDGVLVDSEGISAEVLARSLSAAGLPTSASEALREYRGLLLRDVLERAEARLRAPLPERFADAFERDRMVEFERLLSPVPGAAATVRSLRAAGVSVCVASQGKLEKTELTLRLTGLRDLFGEQALFSAYSVPRGKPYPDLFLHAAATMQVRPEQCVVVEDTTIGVLAARSAGMRVFGYDAGGDETALREAGAEPLRSLTDLPALIGNS